MQGWGLGLAVVTVLAWGVLRWRSLRLGSLLERSLRQTVVRFGHDLWVGVLLTVVGDYLIRASLGVDWVSIAGLTVFAWLFVGLAIFVVYLIRTAFWRSWDRDWAATIHQAKDDNQHATFVLFNRHRQRVLLHGCACTVIDPNGVTSRRIEDRSGIVQEVLILYPIHFEGAPALLSGWYTAIWQDREGGRWRELLTARLRVELPATKTTPYWYRT
jgi:hypothetical protein